MKKLFLTLAFAAATAVASYAQGTVQFQNTALTRMLWKLETESAAGVALPVTKAVNYGLFVNGSQTPLAQLGASSTTSAGLIVAPLGTAFPIPGVAAGATAQIQVRAWSASFGSDWRAAQAAFNNKVAGTLFGESTVASFTLGPDSGPGVVLWSNSDTTKLRPITILEAVPEPSTIALGVLGLGSLLFFRRRQAK